MITEVFVSLDGQNYNKLDLQKDESIPMRYTFKDTQDISKIFSPYSLGFTFEATPKNLLTLGFYGNTDVIKVANLRKLNCKIYVGSILNQFGFLKLEKIKYRNGKPSTITASFATTMTDLGKRIGDDTLNDLGSQVVSWMPADVWSRLQSIRSIIVDGISLRYFIPLASINRVFQYDPINTSAVDNVFFETGINPLSERIIKGKELRPAISFSTIIDLIKKKYNLQIIAPIENRSEYRDAFVWCMGQNLGNANVYSRFDLITNLSGLQFRNVQGTITPPYKYTITSNAFNDTFTIVRNTGVSDLFAYSNFVTLRLTFEGVFFMGDGAKSVTVSLNKVGETNYFLTETLDINQGTAIVSIQINDNLFLGTNLTFQINTSFASPTIWTNSKVDISYSFFNVVFNGDFINPEFITNRRILFYDSNVNNNNAQMGGSTIDLIKALPDMKVIDFLTSFFKSFNISALDVSPNDDSLYWYTPQDIDANKNEVIYIADISEVDKSTQDDFNYYVFQHAESNFKSNTDYKIGAGIDYAKISDPLIKPNDAKEYKVETNFTVIPPVSVAGLPDVVTYYGFESGTPDILTGGEQRYTPNFGELPIFYSHGNTPLGAGVQFAVQDSFLGGVLFTSNLQSYIKALPWTTDFKSIAWSVLVYNNIQYPDTLFSRYYAETIARFLNQNVMKQEFSLYLTTEEMRQFRLENDIVIGENRFSIIDSTIDITTGKTKLTLLNY